MKIKAGEHEIRLLPDTAWEREQLKRLQQHGIEGVEWENSWDQAGDLVLKLRGHPWDKEDPGAR